ncbi:DUF2150 family protein [Methanospirillum lacunae]|uniref:DUF2150 domain-containing protein n=1 Tax=Methanospirillum lacunae TaxID=668570 RepID=A0A2V2NBZ2_9EURY|nr:DUF2150 family protein [Methanospirillum lacunae]PWR72823.1 DUF2150 domain-containing protein [Methanospirillum lacunae]
MAPKKKKDAASAQDEAPLKLFYIFYSQERWENWLKALSEADFEGSADDDEMPEGFQLLSSFNQDICIEVLKIVKLYQNNRFTKEESLQRISDVEEIVLNQTVEGDLEEVIASLQFSMLVLFAATRKFLEGGFDEDIKALVKKGKSIDEEQMEEILEVAAIIGANVINGKSCCGRYIKESDDPGMFDEWLIEVETINEALATLKNFDEEAGESS